MVLIAKEKDKIDNKNDVKESESKNKPIYVKVSDDTRRLIDKYKNQGTTISDLVKNSIKNYDEFFSMSQEIHAIIDKYKNQNESATSFIERALKYYDNQKELDRDLWMRAREEMKMMLIGKTTFNQLIAAAEAPEWRLDKPFKKNVAIDLIMWYNDSRPLKSLTIDQVIATIQKIWVVANYFYKIDKVKDSEKNFHLLFKHRQNKRYSSYWFGYFKELFTSKEMPFKANIEGQSFEESLSITIVIE